MEAPKLYVVERRALAAWSAPNSFTLTFEEASQFIHDLQDSMAEHRHLSTTADLEFFILVIPPSTKPPSLTYRTKHVTAAHTPRLLHPQDTDE